MIEYIEKMKKQDKYEDDKIEKELLEIIENSESLKHRILSSKLKKEQKAIIYGKYLKLQKMDQINSEYHKLKEWIEHKIKKKKIKNIVQIKKNVMFLKINIEKNLLNEKLKMVI